MNNITDIEKKWALAATIIGSGMAFINGSVVNIALPAIQTSLEASVADMQWVISIYAFIIGTLIMTGGAAGDYFGRKRVFSVGVFLFLVFTVWCGLAGDVHQLIIGRGGQAVGGALMIPGSLAIITDLYEGEQRGKAIGTWSGFTALATAAGPLLAGILVDYFSWRFIFLISVPLAIVTLIILYMRVPESNIADQSQTPDWKGALLATVGLGLICFGLIEASDFGISHPLVILSFLVGILIIMVFVWLEKRIDNPMMPLSIFHSATFSGANLVTMFLYFSLAGVFFLLPFVLIQIHGYSATAAGAAFIPFPLLVGGLSRWSGGLIVRYGARPLLVAGLIVTGIGFLFLGIYGSGIPYWQNFFPGIFFMGLGVAIVFAPLNTTVMSSVGKSDAGTASGVNKAVSRLSGMFSVALLGALTISLFAYGMNSEMREKQIPQSVQRQILKEKTNLAKTQIPQDIPAKMRQTLKEMIPRSFLFSFRIVMFIAAGLVWSGAICAAAMIDYHPDPSELEKVRN